MKAKKLKYLYYTFVYNVNLIKIIQVHLISHLACSHLQYWYVMITAWEVWGNPGDYVLYASDPVYQLM